MAGGLGNERNTLEVASDGRHSQPQKRLCPAQPHGSRAGRYLTTQSERQQPRVAVEMPNKTGVTIFVTRQTRAMDNEFPTSDSPGVRYLVGDPWDPCHSFS